MCSYEPVMNPSRTRNLQSICGQVMEGVVAVNL